MAGARALECKMGKCNKSFDSKKMNSDCGAEAGALKVEDQTVLQGITDNKSHAINRKGK